ncbi:phosphoribosylanthranilate isomerase [Phaeodactylibacter luteus]|uniref:N-(5'-phosphoribosyl)anthranilate isomerase n=1 Tax=Phaeodactylibacter luteus TaxID=1564516 RepID=A0A5C6RGX0_9BACT|nr:phosphoribosylanthranilate isomerase [Phaeodactylibacter luteus]TXB60563.1 phosphoribosylanthranilate isomerase [Phaeodactylibacter luteus]
MRTRVKVCCISSREEARLAVAYGADALGLVGPMPSGPGVLKDAEIARIIPGIPPPVASFLLTSEVAAPDIIAHQKRVGANTLQLVDSVEAAACTAVRQALPTVRLVRVIHILDETAVEEALQAAEQADALLLDSGNPNLKVKQLGGTGRAHNWALSRKIVAQATVPVFLAGGLSAANAARAIEEVQPFGLDLCSGVRTAGQLDEAKLNVFFQAVYG